MSVGVTGSAIAARPRRLLDVFTGPERWTQRANSRNAVGERRGGDNRDASCFCLVAALYRVLFPESIGADWDLFSTPYDAHRRWLQVNYWLAISGVLPAGCPTLTGLVDWNDAPDRSFEEVREMAARIDAVLLEKGLIE